MRHLFIWMDVDVEARKLSPIWKANINVLRSHILILSFPVVACDAKLLLKQDSKCLADSRNFLDSAKLREYHILTVFAVSSVVWWRLSITTQTVGLELGLIMKSIISCWEGSTKQKAFQEIDVERRKCDKFLYQTLGRWNPVRPQQFPPIAHFLSAFDSQTRKF